ncbi:MAG TPA: hydrogenase maturation protease [Bacteroidota bacterium]|nr:hydrogenase maturation protease [Bacteroidota bacterium]
METLVVGYGNTLRRDDGAGIAAARAIARAFPGVHVLTAHGLNPEIAEDIARCDLAVFIDASVANAKVCVTKLSPSGMPDEGHALSPSGVLALASGAYGRVPGEALLVEIPAFECGFGETMSGGTLRMIDCCVQLVSELLRGETTPEILMCLAPSPAAD